MRLGSSVLYSTCGKLPLNAYLARRKSMKRSPRPLTGQMNLSLLDAPATAAAPCEQQRELTLALVELLISAAQERFEVQATGEANESPEAHA
jgi:hypothetical protein